MNTPEPESPLEDLGKRLKTARGKGDGWDKVEPSRRDASGVGTGLRIAVDLVAGVVVGVGIGWYLDNWLETKPWFLLVFTIIGFCAGLLNVVRTAKQMELLAKEKAAYEEAAKENTTTVDQDANAAKSAKMD